MRYFITLILLSNLCMAAEKLKIGVTAGPHFEIMNNLKEKAKQEGIDLEVVEFNDFIIPNLALDEGDIFANSYQHLPFLEDQVKTRGYNIISAGKTILLPMGIYSNKIKSLGELTNKAKIGIPNDPTNGGRALLLLEKIGLIKLKTNDNPSILDIKDNPKDLKIIELEAPQLPRSLDDLDIAAINTDWVIVSGLDMSKRITSESTNSPYVNIIAVKTKDRNSRLLQKLLNIYYSKFNKDFIKAHYKGAIKPAW